MMRARLEVVALFAATSALYWVVLLVTSGPGFPLDDSYIHLHFARRFFEEGVWGFNPGAPSSGSTAPLYPFLLAVLHGGVNDWALDAHLLGGLSALGTALMVLQGVWWWTDDLARARTAGVVCAVAAPALANAYAGMETGLTALAVTTGLALYGLPSRRFLGSLVLALCVWLRPEALFFLGLIGLEHLLRPRRLAERGALFIHVALWLAVVIPYLAFNWSLDEHLVPSTFAAKAVARSSGHLLPWWFDGLPAVLAYGRWRSLPLAAVVWPALIAGTVPLSLGLQSPLLWPRLRAAVRGALASEAGHGPALKVGLGLLVLLPAVRGAIDPVGFVTWQFQRYFPFLLPVALLVVLSQGAPPVRRWRWVLACVPGAALVGAWLVLAVGNINEQQVQMAEWVREHTEPGDVVAANDIGALGFIADRPVLDLIGLVSPQVVKQYLAGETTVDVVRLQRPRWVVIFPRWFPQLEALPELSPQHQEVLGLNVISGGKRLVAYEVQR